MPAPPRVPALDGVRALAVLAVLASHAGIPGVSGGFVGVDVFFVLSGFLITSLLLDERNRTGRADLAGFWARRARRLLPAALVMITAVVAFRGLMRPDAVAGLRDDALSAALWFGNWRWATQGTDYFSQGGTASPLQHTWSLAVEEQFYVIWPCLLMLVLAGVMGAHARSRRVTTFALSGVAVSAFVTWRLTASATPGRVYFGTDVRAQELLVGAALAGMLARTWRWRSAPRRARRSPQSASRYGLPTFLSLGGLAVLGIAAHRVHGTPSDFRHGLLLIISVASAALIAGLMLDRRSIVSTFLSMPMLVALGRISYGVYLWHWPVYSVVTGARTGLRTYELAGLRFVVTLVLASLSMALIERPAQRVRIQPRRLLPAAVGAVGAVLVFTACAAPMGRVPVMVPAASGSDLPPGTTAAQVKAAEGLVVQHVKPRPTNHAGPMRVSVFGDSIGWTLAQYLPPTPGLEVLNRTALGCGIVRGGPYTYFGQQYDESDTCNTWPARWLAQVKADQPDEVVLVVGRWETMNRQYNGTWMHIGEPEFDAYLASLVREAVNVLGSTGARVIVASEPYNRRGEQPDGSLYPEDDPTRVDRWNAIVRDQLHAMPDVVLMDLNKELGPNGAFTWDVDGVQVRSDGVHLSPQGVAWLAPWFTDELRRSRVTA
ncbi:MAG TPA: acyltransferase family protein [Jatrophihabitantaceae bacterium]|nr:acyltransferase family protein [Jatrophihabitantaceae bacterium]